MTVNLHTHPITSTLEQQNLPRPFCTTLQPEQLDSAQSCWARLPLQNMEQCTLCPPKDVSSGQTNTPESAQACTHADVHTTRHVCQKNGSAQPCVLVHSHPQQNSQCLVQGFTCSVLLCISARSSLASRSSYSQSCSRSSRSRARVWMSSAGVHAQKHQSMLQETVVH